MNKIFRLFGCFVLVLFVLEVLEPSSIFVRAEIPTLSDNVVVFNLQRIQHYRHHQGSTLIRLDQEKKSEQNQRRDAQDTQNSHHRSVFSHYATVPVRCLGTTVASCEPCEESVQEYFDSLDPSSQIRPPAVI